MKTWILLILLSASCAWAKTVTFEHQTYEEASRAESFVRFDMASTKIGFITTSFSGYVKKFSVTGTVKGETIDRGAQIEFAALDLDTDVGGRNEKMWNLCLEAPKHPQIAITLGAPLELDGAQKELPATLRLRGVDNNIVLTARAVRAPSGDLVVDFAGELSIKALAIPDPSIAVASVKDKIKVRSHILVPM